MIPPRPLLAASLLLAAVLPAQGDAAAVAAQLRKAFRAGEATRDVAACEAALQAAKEADSGAVAEALVAAYARLEQDVDAITAERQKLLGGGGGSVRLGPLRYRLRPIHGLQDRILERLAGLKSAEAVGVLLGGVIGQKGKLPWTLQLALADRAVDAGPAELQRLLAATDAADATEPVLLLLRAIEPLGSRARDAAEWAIRMLAHADPVVRAQAATTLGRLGHPAALRPLIDRLDAEQGELREGLLDALVVLTGVCPGDAAASWRLWLEQEGKPFLDGTVRLGRGDPSLRERQQPAGTRATYFGLEQRGDSILYVVDVSLSMRAAAPGGGSRWQLCKKELVAAVQGLLPEQRFNIVTFANHVRVFEPRMKEASPRNVRRAVEWIEDLDLEFETNVYDALELAFLLGGRGVRDRYYEPGIDTIFFLSDGAPTIPRDPEAPPPRERGGGGIGQDRNGEILAAVRRWNALSRVAIHTIGLGLPEDPPAPRGPGGGQRGGPRQQPARAFLRRLAAQNRGTFVEPQ